VIGSNGFEKIEMIFNSDKTRAKDAAKNLEKAEFKKGLYK
jgi:hypothetical protein